MNGGLFSDEGIEGPFPEGIRSLLYFIGVSRLQAFHALRSVPSLNVNRMSSLLWTVAQSAGVYQAPSLDCQKSFPVWSAF